MLQSPANRAANASPRDMSDQAISPSSDIIYTPPESETSMTSPTDAGESKHSPSQANASEIVDRSTTTITASHIPLPVSAQDISGAASNISKREYIYFLPYPLPPGTEIPYSIHLPEKNPLNLPSHQFEPTSTLVLTSPLKTFVDVRMYKAFDTLTASIIDDRTNDDDGDNKNNSNNTAATNRGSTQPLEWAFAGTSTSVPTTPLPSTTEQEWKNVTHSTWTHWVDSRFSVGDPNIPVDEGDMYPISRDLTLEVGHAWHPALKAEKTHEEMWRDEDVLSTRLGSDDTTTTTTGKAKSKICVVLRCQADVAGVRGVVVRVGQYVQGVLMRGDKTTAERWEWRAENEGRGEVEKWQRTVRVGDEFLPCAVAFRTAVLAVGGKVRFHEFEWVVEEVWEWL
ncbi:hypothetical protein DDE82_006359 [Stemphylium lycopersici]|nr:hypothetical protein TW65_06371 [Stemphylium lycopersici]RAR01610.1 hypothetical protein DDE82_006359 [Stemphylium lycopersici]